MGANSKIEWTHHTFNPWRGCQHAVDDAGAVHPACEHCYAEAMSKRNPSALGKWGNDGTRVVASEAMWRQPLKWNHQAQEAGERRRVFCASLADVFEDWKGAILGSKDGAMHHGAAWGVKECWVEHFGVFVGRSLVTMNDLRRRLFETIDATPWLDWLLLTKRPENVRRMWCSHVNTDGSPPSQLHRPNVWLGTSISDQATADVWIPRLLECRELAPVLFLSIEPLLGPIDFTDHLCFYCPRCGDVYHDCDGDWAWPSGILEPMHFCGPERFACGGRRRIDWVIVGGESGPHARPMHPAWARSIRDQCQGAGVSFFFKQIGEWDWFTEPSNGQAVVSGDLSRCGFLHGDGRLLNYIDGDDAVFVGKVGKAKAGRLLDGAEWSQFPNSCSVSTILQRTGEK